MSTEPSRGHMPEPGSQVPQSAPAGSDLAAAVASLTPPPGTVLMAWLGQAGFLLKTSSGRVLMIDPYLSDAAERSHGLARVVDPPLQPWEITPDLLLVTHDHVDHLDPETVRAYADNGHTTLVGPPAACAMAREDHGWKGRSVPLAAGTSTTILDVRLEATWTRHGRLDDTQSVGFLLEIEGLSVWHLGDTEYDSRLHRGRPRPDVVLLPMNGAGGNMNAFEAALLVWELGVGLAIPMHFGMWSSAAYTYRGTEPWATPDPALFTRTLSRLDRTVRYHVPELAQPVWLTPGMTSGSREIGVETIRAGGGEHSL